VQQFVLSQNSHRETLIGGCIILKQSCPDHHYTRLPGPPQLPYIFALFLGLRTWALPHQCFQKASGITTNLLSGSTTPKKTRTALLVETDKSDSGAKTEDHLGTEFLAKPSNTPPPTPSSYKKLKLLSALPHLLALAFLPQFL
jgi:hypothetical protein